jgi:hypothetical protein
MKNIKPDRVQKNGLKNSRPEQAQNLCDPVRNLPDEKSELKSARMNVVDARNSFDTLADKIVVLQSFSRCWTREDLLSTSFDWEGGKNELFERLENGLIQFWMEIDDSICDTNRLLDNAIATIEAEIIRKSPKDES